MYKELFKYDCKTGVLIDVILTKNTFSYKTITEDNIEVFRVKFEKTNGVDASFSYTDVKPNTTIYPNISPIYNEESKTWATDEQAVHAHLEVLKKPKEKTTAEYMVDLDYRLTLMELGV